MSEKSVVRLGAAKLISILLKIYTLYEALNLTAVAARSAEVTYYMNLHADENQMRFAGFMSNVRVGFDLLAIAALTVVFVNSERISKFILRDDSVIEFEGNPDQWASILLQFFGITLLLSGLSGFLMFAFAFTFPDLVGNTKASAEFLVPPLYGVIGVTAGIVLIVFPKGISGWLQSRR